MTLSKTIAALGCFNAALDVWSDAGALGWSVSASIVAGAFSAFWLYFAILFFIFGTDQSEAK